MSNDDAFKLEGVAPVFPVTDMRRSLAYYRDKLLFSADFEWSDSESEPTRYAVLQQGNVELHLTSGAAPNARVAYVLVRNVRAFHDAVKANGAEIVEALADHPWSMREFAVTDPDGNRLIFGERVPRDG